ncbi:MAG: hypothetical protein QNJ55_36650 [Xenococcus sp. MO_188.B8]|nr:hypothetical protein [Xenococcus sp. MO_188.B8]
MKEKTIRTTLSLPAELLEARELLLDCCDLDWRSQKTQLIMQEPPYFASQINAKRLRRLIDLVEVGHEQR